MTERQWEGQMTERQWEGQTTEMQWEGHMTEIQWEECTTGRQWEGHMTGRRWEGTWTRAPLAGDRPGFAGASLVGSLPSSCYLHTLNVKFAVKQIIL